MVGWPQVKPQFLGEFDRVECFSDPHFPPSGIREALLDTSDNLFKDIFLVPPVGENSMRLGVGDIIHFHPRWPADVMTDLLTVAKKDFPDFPYPEKAFKAIPDAFSAMVAGDGDRLKGILLSLPRKLGDMASSIVSNNTASYVDPFIEAQLKAGTPEWLRLVSGNHDRARSVPKRLLEMWKDTGMWVNGGVATFKNGGKDFVALHGNQVDFKIFDLQPGVNNLPFFSSAVTRDVMHVVDRFFAEKQYIHKEGQKNPPWYNQLFSSYSEYMMKKYKRTRIDTHFETKPTLIYGHTHYPKFDEENRIVNIGCLEPFKKTLGRVLVEKGLVVQENIKLDY